jgi:hypothetical protein
MVIKPAKLKEESRIIVCTTKGVKPAKVEADTELARDDFFTKGSYMNTTPCDCEGRGRGTHFYFAVGQIVPHLRDDHLAELRERQKRVDR